MHWTMVHEVGQLHNVNEVAQQSQPLGKMEEQALTLDPDALDEH